MQKRNPKGALVIVALALLVGGIGGSVLHVSAADAQTPIQSGQTTGTTASATAAQPAAQGQGQFDPTKGGHTANGITEQLLTGDTAEKVKAAALVAVPGGTIQRVETDAEGATYEAHMTKSDGSHVTVKFDSSFKVTGIETGGQGPHPAQ